MIRVRARLLHVALCSDVERETSHQKNASVWERYKLALALDPWHSRQMDRMLFVIQVHSQSRQVIKTYNTEIPSHLNGVNACDVQLQSQYESLFKTRWGVFKEDRGPFRCCGCGKRAHVFKFYPMNGDCAIVCLVTSLCSFGTCEAKAGQMRDSAVSEALQQWNIVDVVIKHGCVACGQTANTQKCARCKLTPYCSTTCQRTDWPKHKSICKARVNRVI